MFCGDFSTGRRGSDGHVACRTSSVIVVVRFEFWKLDRVGRSPRSILSWCSRQMKSCCVRLVSIRKAQ